MTARDWVDDLRYLGCGLGYRRELADRMFAAPAQLDCVELLSDQFIGQRDGLDKVRRVCDTFSVIPHGVGLSVGSATGLDREYLRAIKRVSDLTGSPYYSEHLCMTRVPGIDIGHLAPLRFTEEELEQTIRNVHTAQDALEKPLALENVTYTVELPRSEMSQPEFFQRLVEATGCGILLDVTNVHINATNHGFDPHEFLDLMPLERVVHIHLAGGYFVDDYLIDSHSRPVDEETWDLLQSVADRTSACACIIEHDDDYPDSLDPLLEQLDRARGILGSPVARALPG